MGYNVRSTYNICAVLIHGIFFPFFFFALFTCFFQNIPIDARVIVTFIAEHCILYASRTRIFLLLPFFFFSPPDTIYTIIRRRIQHKSPIAVRTLCDGQAVNYSISGYLCVQYILEIRAIPICSGAKSADPRIRLRAGIDPRSFTEIILDQCKWVWCSNLFSSDLYRIPLYLGSVRRMCWSSRLAETRDSTLNVWLIKSEEYYYSIPRQTVGPIYPEDHNIIAIKIRAKTEYNGEKRRKTLRWTEKHNNIRFLVKKIPWKKKICLTT